MTPRPAGSVPPPQSAGSPAVPDDPSTLDADEVARIWRADLDRGLTTAEAAHRLARDGPNELRAAPPTAR